MTSERRWVLALVVAGVVAVLAAPPAGAKDGGELLAPPPIAATLDQASHAGWLTVEGRYPTGGLEIELVLTSRSPEPQVVDVAGRHLTPREGRRVQRLGLSHPVAVTPLPGYAEGVFAVALAPRETRRLLMRCCCMDEGLNGPEPRDRYMLASADTPPVIEAALRWWVEHRTAPREFVNPAVWKSDLTLLEGTWGPSDPRYTPPEGEVVRSFNGVLFLLDRGRLTSVNPRGARHELATGIRQVFPAAGTVFGVADGPEGPELCRVAGGATPCERLFPVGPDPVLDLWQVPRGPYVWRTAKGVFLRQTSDEPTQLVYPAARSLRLSIAPLDLTEGRFLLVDRQARSEKGTPFVVNDFDARAGTVVPRKTYWTLRDMAAGPGGVFALSPGGTVTRLRGGALVPLGRVEGAERIVAAGRDRLVLARGDEGLASYWSGQDPVALESAVETTAGDPEPTNLSMDPITDEVYWTVDRSIRRLVGYESQVVAFPSR